MFRTNQRTRPSIVNRAFGVERLEERQLLSSSGLGALLRTMSRDTRAAAHVGRAHAGPEPVVAAARASAVEQQLPDMIVWASEEREYLHGWHIDTDEQPGRRLMRFSNAVANIGVGPIELRGSATNPDGSQVVLQRIYNQGGSFIDREVGTFTFHPEHGHIHFDDYAVYNLRAMTENDGVGDIVAAGGKVSFCLLDVTMYEPAVPGTPQVERYNSCGQNQGISVGWADVYDSSLADQWIDITDVPDGTYWLESVADPSDRLVESDETNNVARIKITLGPPPPDDFANTFDLATPIELARGELSAQAGTIGEPLDVDMFSVVAPKKGKLTINQIGTGGLDSFLTVYDENQTEIARDDDGGDGLNSRVRIKVQFGQKLFVQAGGFESDTGRYELTITMGRGRHVNGRADQRIGIKNLLRHSHDPLDV